MKTELANGCYSLKDGDSLIYYNQQRQLHREDGPAFIWYKKDGSIDDEAYFLYGMYITNEHFNDQRFVTQLHLENIG